MTILREENAKVISLLEIAFERRKRRAIERVRTNNPKCTVCGEDHVHCLERHHVAGKDYGGTTVIVCRNCHRELTDKQKDHVGGTQESAAAFPDQVAHFLFGLADLLELLIAKLREFADGLIANREAVQ